VILAAGTQSINGNVTGNTTTNFSNVTNSTLLGHGVLLMTGNHVINGSVSGVSALQYYQFNGTGTHATGVYFASGNQTVRGNIYGSANKYEGVLLEAANLTMQGSDIAGYANNASGVAIRGGKLTYMANLTITGRAMTANGSGSAINMTAGNITNGVGAAALLTLNGGNVSNGSGNRINLLGGKINAGLGNVTLYNWGAPITQGLNHSITAGNIFLTGNGSTTINGNNTGVLINSR
jgi:hypothetical protein